MAAKRFDKIVWVIIGAGALAATVFFVYRTRTPGTYDTFAQCLKDKQAIFYGAFWCPHCQDQKKLFGKSEKLLPYVECSTPDGKAQLDACQEKEIQSYPTWDFPDGSRLTGVVALATLAEKTGCALP